MFRQGVPYLDSCHQDNFPIKTLLPTENKRVENWFHVLEADVTYDDLFFVLLCLTTGSGDNDGWIDDYP
jgi:hypothetical protein